MEKDESISRDSSMVATAPLDPCAQESSQPYPSGLVLGMTLFALCLGVFCVALDNTIISNAIPHMTDEFHALQDVGWYGSAYFLTTCSFQLPFGKLYSIFKPKMTFLISLLLFEVGSVICAAAPSSGAFIIGRAVAGIGSAGISNGAVLIIALSSPLEKRPIYISLLGGMFGIASVLGPLLGGLLTYKATWRWCFWINLPLGFVTLVIICYTLHHLNTTRSSRQYSSKRALLWSLDPVGFILLVSGVVCALLAFKWGGTTYAWNSSEIISLLVFFGVCIICFCGVQIWLGEEATIPPRIACQQTMWSASLFTLTLSGTYYLIIYFIPMYFQAVKDMTALTSGKNSIPLILFNVVGCLMSGTLTTQLGYYMPFIYIAVICTCIATALLTTITPASSAADLIGYQMLYGFGSGCGFQLPQIAAQAVLPSRDVQTGIAITLFFLNFGGALFVSVGNNVFNSQLLRYLSALDLDGLDPEVLVKDGATAIRWLVSDEMLESVIDAYSCALVAAFRVGLVLSCVSAIGAVFMEWKSVKTNAPKGNQDG